MDEDYNFYDEDINQPNWPKVVIALLLIVVAVASYFGYQKFIKGKEKTDIQIFQTAMKEYMDSKDKNIPNLMLYASKLKMEDKVRFYTEVML